MSEARVREKEEKEKAEDFLSCLLCKLDSRTASVWT